MLHNKQPQITVYGLLGSNLNFPHHIQGNKCRPDSKKPFIGVFNLSWVLVGFCNLQSWQRRLGL